MEKINPLRLLSSEKFPEIKTVHFQLDKRKTTLFSVSIWYISINVVQIWTNSIKIKKGTVHANLYQPLKNHTRTGCKLAYSF